MDLVQAENGKARRDAFLEVADIANTGALLRPDRPRLLRDKRRTGLFPGLTATPRAAPAEGRRLDRLARGTTRWRSASATPSRR